MLVVFFRGLILFTVVFLVIRLMGNRELSKVQPFELAIIVMISDLASGPMQSRDTQIFAGVIPIIALLILYGIFTLIIQSSNKVESVICGNPSLIIYKGKILENEMKKQQLTIEELMEQLRGKDIYTVQETAYAILETNGDLNAVKMADATGNNIPLNVIVNGEYADNNIKMLNLTRKDIDKKLLKKKLKLKNVLIATIDANGVFLYQEKEKKVWSKY